MQYAATPTGPEAAPHLLLALQALPASGSDQTVRYGGGHQSAAMQGDGGEFGPETDLKACPGCQRVKPLYQFHRNRTK